MKAIIKLPGKEPEIIEAESDLQELVGGYLEHVCFVRGIGILCDEEGLYKGPVVNGKPTSLPYNFFLPHVGALVGPVLFVGESHGVFVDLDERQVSLILGFLNIASGDRYAK